MLIGYGSLYAQQKADSFTQGGSNLPHDPRTDQMNFVPNEIIVKFKDQTPVVSGNKLMSIGISGVDRVLRANGVSALTRVFSSAPPQAARVIRTPQGKEMTIPRLDNIYRIKLPAPASPDSMPTNIFKVIDQLKAQPEVEYAEPDYIYSIDAAKPVGPILTAEDVKKMQPRQQSSANGVVVPNDPLYGQQWYIPAVKADSVWAQTMGDSTEVIAIVDTGVDWTHPDLMNNIWKNPNPNTTPDANGVVNDIRGWDFINNDNNPMDDNSHGTHVAGIAAAQANNGIGIAGVCPKAKIMPIKVFQSSGRGDAATIAKGIIYASSHGATVINMSFGSYARSLTMEAALSNAYATCVLVAAAGNDGKCIGPGAGCAPFYPAALSYVLGVQASEALFSNHDQDGPTFSNYSDLLNYEMKAPGTNIISTIPNGDYRVYQGTSMAAPIVSGAVSLYRKLIPYDKETNEFMWVKLIQATGEYLNINKALTIKPKPEIWFLNKVIVDTIGTDNKDGIIDAGETIQLCFFARNTGGQVDSVYWKIRLAEFEDTTTCKIVKSTSFLGSISPYSTRTSENDPMKIIFSNKVAHDRDITFDLLSWYKGSSDTVVQKVVFNVQNGKELSGILMNDIVLTPDKLWLFNKSLRISDGVKVTILPGTSIEVNTFIDNRGIVKAFGNKDSLINIKFTNNGILQGNCEYKYINFYGENYGLYASKIENAYIDGGMNQIGNANNCNFNNANVTIDGSQNSFFNNSYLNAYNLDKCIMYNSQTYSLGMGGGNYTYNVFDKKGGQFSIGDANITSYLYKNSFLSVKHIISTQGNESYVNLPDQYWGSNNEEIIKTKYFDFLSYSGYPYLNIEPKLNSPSDSCHAFVWKVLVNGKDAQDEVVDPLGVGKQRFDVYFNRAMDTTITPQVSFGVRYPYTQQTVNQNGSWSADGKIYTVYKTISLTTGDGINRIRVAGAKEANGWNFEIPVEDMRFNFVVNAAGSASIDFMATPGLGKVKLEWNNNNLADGLGYNMYRMTQINDSTLSTPVMVNKSLITDTLYTDFDVVPNQKYFYYYKILRTNLAETDSSKVVSAIPFTASKGDANGDLAVNVLDVTSIVAYLLNQNPQPFIFDAADVNGDKTINVLDVVGVVNLILNGGQKTSSIASIPEADLYLQNDTLFANTTAPVGGIQFEINGVTSSDQIQSLPALNGFESGHSLRGDTLRLLYYSMTGKTLPVADHIPLLKLSDGNKISNAVFGDAVGASFNVNFISTNTKPIETTPTKEVAKLEQNYPNPFNDQTIIPVHFYQPVDGAVIRIINLNGQTIQLLPIFNLSAGDHTVTCKTGIYKGILMYRLELRQGKNQWISTPLKMLVK